LLGACHGLEVPFVFGTLDHERAGDLTGRGPAAHALSERMQEAWIAFATHGDPGWPAYDLERRATRRFGETCDVELDPMAAERRFWDGRL
jgi:carboxylesterase type B